MLTTFAIVLGLGLAVAFTANANDPVKTESEMSTLHWFDPSDDSYQGQNTVPTERMETGCPETSGIECERGYLVSQLINPGDPEQGVKPSEESNPQTIIYRLTE